MGVLKVGTVSGFEEISINSDHGTLSGLGDNDHPQYTLSATNSALSSLVTTNQTNSEAVSSTVFDNSATWATDNDTTDHTALTNIGTNTHAQIDTHITELTNVSSTVFDNSATWATDTDTTDHGAFTGLGDDDHPQYVLSATNTALSSLVTTIDSQVAVLEATVDNGILMFPKTSSQATTASWADVTGLATPTVSGTDYTVNTSTGEITIDASGTFAISYHFLGLNTAAGRAGFSVRLQFNEGGGYAVETLTQSGGYARFNANEPWAIATIPRYIKAFDATDKIKAQTIHTTNILNMTGYISVERLF